MDITTPNIRNSKSRDKYNSFIITSTFAIIILFYGQNTLRALFTWLPSTVCIILSILLILKKGKINKFFLRIFLINSLWLIYSLIFTFAYTNIEIHLKAIFETLLYILTFTILIFYNLKSEKKLFKMLLTSLNVFLLVSLGVALLKIFGLYDNGKAFSSIYSNRNNYAFVGLFYLAIILNLPKQLNYRFKNFVILLLVLLILSTASTKGVLGILLIFTINLIQNFNTKKIIFITVSMTIALVSLNYFFNNTVQRLYDKLEAISGSSDGYNPDNIGHDSGKIRVYLYESAYEIFLNHKWIGVGTNNGQFYITVPSAKKNTLDTLDSQNNITEMLLNAGIPGFLLYYIPLLYLMYRCLKTDPINYDIKIMIITLITLKIIIDFGMKSYNDAAHVLLVILSWSLYYRYIDHNSLNSSQRKIFTT